MSEEATQVWDLATHRPAGAPLPQHGMMAAVQFSPDSRVLATASMDGNVMLWDPSSGRLLGDPLRHRNLVRGVIFSRDGRKLLTWTPLESRVWDVATREPIIEPVVGGNDVWTAVLSDDGTRFATWSRTDGTVRLWGSTSGQLLSEPIRVASVGLGWRFAGNGRFLAALGSRMAVWPVPPQSGHHAVPEWLLRLATMVAGGEIDPRATFREQAFDARAFAGLRRELEALPEDSLYLEWGRWFFSDRASRPIAPGFKIGPAEPAGFDARELPPSDAP